MSRVIQPGKLLGETKNYTWDFTSSLGASETISAAVCTASVYSGTDASPSSLLSGSASISGQTVSQLLTAGTLGVIYEVLCTITTSLGQTLQLSSYVAVVPDLE